MIKGMFDINPRLIGLVVRGVEIRSIDNLEQFIVDNEVQIAALTIPKSKAPEIADRLVRAGIKAIWNFCPYGPQRARRCGGGKRSSFRESDASFLPGMQYAGRAGAEGTGKNSMILGTGCDLVEIERMKKCL